MITFTDTIDTIYTSYNLHNIAPLSEILFVDIETTGFSAGSSYLYMIGCLYYHEESWHIIQWFAPQYEEEVAVLSAFLDFCSNFRVLIHFNGNNFDIPYLMQKCTKYQLPSSFASMEGIDLYKRIAPYKAFLGLENCKQRTIEHFLDIYRTDTFDGGQLISVYHDYVKNPSQESLEMLLLHNADDMRGMFSILPVLSYTDIFLLPFRVVKVQANHFEDITGSPTDEVLMKIHFSTSFDKPFALNVRGCRFRVDGQDGYLKVPLYVGELKYFYSNYKDYYYLPEEDIALHKSIASFVDKDHRIQADARNCYTKKHGNYLPQWDILFSPIFKTDYNDSICYFELTEDMKKQPEVFRQYSLHILDMMAHDTAASKKNTSKK